MTNIEMQYEFTKLIQEMDERFESITRPSTETIFRMLNYSISRYIKDRYLSGPTMKANVQEIQYRADDLRNLIVPNVDVRLVAALTGYANHQVELPENYMFYIRSDSKIKRSVAPAMSEFEWTPNRVANYDEIDKIVTTPTNKPILRKPVIVFNANTDSEFLTVFYDQYTEISDVMLTYLRQPRLLVLEVSDNASETDTCELAVHTHEEIVKLAVGMYIDELKLHLAQPSK